MLLGWIGYNKDINVPGQISTMLKGYGSASLEFGNCINEGTVKVFLNDKEIGSTIDKKERKTIQFEFWHGDTLVLKEEKKGMILFSDFKYTCTGDFFYVVDITICIKS